MSGTPGAARTRDLRQWTGWLRSALELPDVETAWYGGATNVYYVIVNSQGTAPPEARPIYARDGVTILARPRQFRAPAP